MKRMEMPVTLKELGIPETGKNIQKIFEYLHSTAFVEDTEENREKLMNSIRAGLLGQPVSSGIYISSVCVILLTAVIRRRIPRFTTFITSFLLGVFTDLWQRICLNSGISTLHPYLLFAGGMIIVAFCAAAYMEGDLPPGPTDDLVVAFHRKGLGLGNVKLVMDLICAAMAFCLGGEIGAGTVLLTFGLGPLIGGFHTYILKAVNKFENRGKTYENEDRENFCGGPDD